MIELYCDGAAFPNPGECAIGIVLVYKGHIKEVGEKIGTGTNNIAELTAIKRGLELIKDKTRPITIISDSQYALNCISGKFKPSKNIELISSIKTILDEFEDFKLKWVRGHSGNKYQERADHLANQFFINGYYL